MKKTYEKTVHFHSLSLSPLKQVNPPAGHDAWVCRALYE